MDEGHGWQEYKRGCRCDVCREGNTARAREYRAEHGIKRTSAQVLAEQRYEAKRKAKRKAAARGVRISKTKRAAALKFKNYQLGAEKGHLTRRVKALGILLCRAIERRVVNLMSAGDD